MSRWTTWRAAATAVALGVGALGLAPLVAGSAQAATTDGFFVKSGRLYESNGSEFVINGINHAHVWYSSQTSSFAAIKAAGANTVRVVLGGGRWGPSTVSDVSNVISLCRTNKLICVLEDHDTTGYQEQSGSTSLDAAASYWISIADALKGQEKYVIINIGNEPWGNNGYTGWTADTQAAIKKLRAAGFTHTLMVDAPNWGQDWAGTMRDNAASVFAADSLANTVFSIHMYGVYNTADKVKSYLDAFTSKGLPILVGEFGNMHSDGDPDEDTIMSYTRAQGLGMMGWSWSGNSGGVEYLDMVTGFNPAQLTTWGQRFVNGTDGLKSRGVKEATVYSGVTTSTTTTTTTTTSTTSTTTTKTTKSTKPGKTKTVKKCRTGKNGKKTCKTITKKVKAAAAPVTLVDSSACKVLWSQTAAWPGASVGEVTVVAARGVSATISSTGGAQIAQVLGSGRVAAGNAVVTGTATLVSTGANAAVPTAVCN